MCINYYAHCCFFFQFLLCTNTALLSGQYWNKVQISCVLLLMLNGVMHYHSVIAALTTIDQINTATNLLGDVQA